MIETDSAAVLSTCKFTLNPGEPENWRDQFTVKMAKGVAAGANNATDAVARYRNTFLNFGADVNGDDGGGVAVLRALFTILFGLGMRESEGKHCVGWDHDKVTGWNNPAKAVVPTETNAEAGLFQLSYDVGVGVAGDFKDLYDKYRERPDSGFLDAFSEGVVCGIAKGADFVGPGGPAWTSSGSARVVPPSPPNSPRWRCGRVPTTLDQST